MNFIFRHNLEVEATTPNRPNPPLKKSLATWAIVIAISLAVIITISVVVVVKLELDYRWTNGPEREASNKTETNKSQQK